MGTAASITIPHGGADEATMRSIMPGIFDNERFQALQHNGKVSAAALAQEMDRAGSTVVVREGLWHQGCCQGRFVDATHGLL